MKRSTLAVALIAAVVMAGCAGVPDVGAAESELSDQYLKPLKEAGIGVGQPQRCNLDGPEAKERMHLVVYVDLSASPNDVARHLAERGVEIRTDRDPMIVQQNPGQPERGWNGTLQARPAGSRLGLTYNNVRGQGPGATWAKLCR